MTDLLSDERLVWFLMRGSGIVLLAIFTAAVVLGVLASHGGASRPGAALDRRSARQASAVSRFALTRVHRDISLICLVLLAVHALSAAYHSFVDISWLDVLVPFVSTYEPLWIGLGTLALDLVIAASLAAAMRDRLGPRSWRAVHVTTYLAWVIAVIHTVGIGTDRDQVWAIAVGAASAAAFLVAVIWRLTFLRRDAVPLVREGQGW